MLILIIIQTNLLLNTYFLLGILNFLFRRLSSSTYTSNQLTALKFQYILCHKTFQFCFANTNLKLFTYFSFSSIISSYLSTIVLDDKLV